MSVNTKPITRQWNLLRLLSAIPAGLPLNALAEKLRVSDRTIHRDLAMLQGAGLPIYSEIGKHGAKIWRLETDHFDTCPTFSYDEAAALYIGRRFLEPMMGTFLWEAAHTALRKIRNQLGARAVRYLERLVDSISNTTVGWSDYSEKSDLIDALLLGCEEHRQVTITYHSLKSECSETYSIHPYRLLQHKGAVYLVGYSVKAQALRHWKLDRMGAATVTEERFEISPDFVVEKWLQQIFGVYPAEELKLTLVRVLFDTTVARYVTEHHWHDSQHLKPQENGSLVVEFRLSEAEELKRWVLSFGKHAEILEPNELREDIREEITALNSRYTP